MTNPKSAEDVVRRIDQLRQLLRSSRGVSAGDIAARLGLHRTGALRLVRALERSGERILRDRESRRVLFRIATAARTGEASISSGELFVLHFLCGARAMLDGTGLQVYADDLLAKLSAGNDRKRAQLTRRMEQKLLQVDDLPMRYGDMADIVDEITTALLNENPLMLTLDSGKSAKRTVRFDPYTLLGYKRGLYLVGYSHHYQMRRTHAFDAIVGAERIAGERFEYPDDYDPRAELGDAFGIMRGGRTDVHVRFAPAVARYVMRRRWHRSQAFVMARDGWLHMKLRIDGTNELRNALMSYGEFMEVVAPLSLREEIASAAAKMAAAHASEPGDHSGLDWARASR